MKENSKKIDRRSEAEKRDARNRIHKKLTPVMAVIFMAIILLPILYEIDRAFWFNTGILIWVLLWGIEGFVFVFWFTT